MSLGELQPLLLQLEPEPGPLTPQILRPLRWAITAAEPQASGGCRLQIEAVILRPGAQR